MTGDLPKNLAATGPEPWAMQKGERTRAYLMFQAWLYQEPPRSHEDVAEQFGTSITNVRNLSQRHMWSARGRAWDDMRAREGQKAYLAEQRKRMGEFGRQSLAISSSLQRIGTIELARWMHKLGADVASPDTKQDPGLKLGELLQVVDAAERLHRLNTGQATENLSVDANVTGTSYTRKKFKDVLANPKARRALMAFQKAVAESVDDDDEPEGEVIDAEVEEP